MTSSKSIIFALVVLFIIIGITGQVSGTEHTCNNKGEINFCISSFETNKNTLTEGTVAEGEVEVINTGNKSGDVVIIVGLEDSKSSYTYHRVGDLSDINPGENQQYEFQLEAKDSSTLGEHRINVKLMDPAEKHLYDATGYTTSIYIEEQSISIGWLINKFNKITVGVSALLGILAYFVGKRAN